MGYRRLHDFRLAGIAAPGSLATDAPFGRFMPDPNIFQLFFNHGDRRHCGAGVFRADWRQQPTDYERITL